MVNRVTLVGNLGKDPESRTSNNGMAITNLTLATSDRRKGADGNWEEETEWHRIVCFGKTAENAARFLRKGKQVYVEGKIKTRKWTDKDGKDHWTTEILANQITFLAGGGREQGLNPDAADAAAAPLETASAVPDDDIPF